MNLLFFSSAISSLKNHNMRPFCKQMARVSLAALFLAQSGCSSFSGDSSLSQLSLPANSSEALSLKMDWSINVTASSHTKLTPSVLGRTLYTGNGSTGKIQAFNTATSALIWSYQSPVMLQGTLSSNTDLLLATTKNGDLVALDSDSGRLLWQSPLKRRITGQIQFLPERLVAWTEEASVLALSRKDGEIQWSHDFPASGLLINGQRSGTLALGGIFTGTPKGKLAVLDAQTGQSYWESTLIPSKEKLELNPFIDASTTAPLVNATLACASTAYHTSCVDRLKGTPVWTYPKGTLTGLESDGINLFATSPQGHVFSLHAQSGKKLWEYTALMNTPLLKPELMKGSVWVASTQHAAIIQLDADTGRYQKAHPLPSPIEWMKALDDNTLIVNMRDGSVRRYTLLDSSSHPRTGVSRP